VKWHVKCDEWKTRSYFCAANNSSDGLRGEREACSAGRAKEYYAGKRPSRLRASGAGGKRTQRNTEKYAVDQRRRASGVRAAADRRGHSKRKDNPFLMPEARSYLWNWGVNEPFRVRLVIGG
jgi:hypothetical protein